MKKELMEDDRDRDAWLGPMLRQTPQTAPDPCVDPDTLAAWADGKLDAGQTAAVELHASKCARCMAMLAAIERSAPAKAPEEGRSWAIGPLWRWIVPLTAAATAVAIWVVVPNREATQVPSTAQRQSAEPPPAPQDSARSSEPARRDARELALPDAAVPATPAPEAKTAPPAAVDRLEERAAGSPFRKMTRRLSRPKSVSARLWTRSVLPRLRRRCRAHHRPRPLRRPYQNRRQRQRLVEGSLRHQPPLQTR
jgi:hypothetical protein